MLDMWYLAYADRIVKFRSTQVRELTNLPDDWLERNLALIAFGIGNRNWGHYEFDRDMWRLDTGTYTMYLRHDITGALENVAVTVKLRK